jgi:hypothetical protein
MKKAAEVLSQFLDQAQLEKARSYNSFFRSWRTIAGIDISSHSRIREIERKVLLIEADHPGWAQMIELRKRSLLREIKKRYPELEIAEIRVWIVEQFSVDEPRQSDTPEQGDRSGVSAEDPKADQKVPGADETPPLSGREHPKAAEDPRLNALLASIGEKLKNREKGSSESGSGNRRH